MSKHLSKMWGKIRQLLTQEWMQQTITSRLMLGQGEQDKV